MPDMGIGLLGNANLIIKRKFRWTFQVTRANGGNIPPNFVKLASRPNIEIEEVELNYLNAKKWITGKASWQTITVTYIDVASALNQNLWNWLASAYDFTDPIALHMGSSPRDYAGQGVLIMYDACGTPLEQWTLLDLWPTGINFGELDYSSSEEANIELTLRYSDVQYQSFCPGFTPVGQCTPCG